MTYTRLLKVYIYKIERKTLFSFLQDKLPAEALASLDEQVLKDIIDNYKPSILGELIGKLETDDASYILENLDIE